MVFMQSVSRLLSRFSRLRFSYRMLWRDAYLLQLFPNVVLYTGLIWDYISLHHMKQSDRASPYFGFHWTKRQSFAVLRFYETEWHSFAVFWFLKYRVTELHLEFLSQDKVTELHVEFVSRDKVTELRIEFVSRGRLSETYFVVNDQSKAPWNARQRIKPGSTSPRDPKTSSGALQELNKKASAFWPYQFLQRAAHLDKPNSICPGQVTFWRTHAATSGGT